MAEYVQDAPTFLREVVAFLCKWKTASLATIDDAGKPHAANIQYACDPPDSETGDAPRLYFVSNEQSAHSRHIARGGVMAMTIYAHVRRPDHIHGLQIHAQCAAIAASSPAREHAWRIYSARYPFVKVPPLRQRVRAETFYCVTPTWIRFVDNRKGFGFKQQWRSPVVP